MARRVDHEERKRAIAKRAIRLFSQVGYDNVSLIMIAAAAGLPRTVLYRYYCSKREIMDAAILLVIGVLDARLREVLLDGTESTVARLERVCHATVEIMFENKEFLIAVFDFVVGMVRTGADMNGVIRQFTAGIRGTMTRLVELGRRRGEFAAVLDAGRTTDVLYSEFESSAMRIVLGTEADPTTAKQRFSDIVRAVSSWS